MQDELRLVSEHMLNLGLGALAHSNWHANYHSMDNPYWSELSVLQAAHAAEILVKARIAQEHPLLIFESLPRPNKPDVGQLELVQLIEQGRTYQYADLPDRLWATTGIRLPNVELYRSFGKLRNAIQHFAPPDHRDASQEAAQFIFAVIDPFINSCWGLFAIDYNEDYEPYVYLLETLIRRGVLFLVSPECVEHIQYADLEWPTNNPAYCAEMETRFKAAKI
jgi:hypothetical protein